MIFRFLNIFLIPVITLTIIWAVGWLWFASVIYFTSEKTATTKTDAIIVLTGGSGRISKGLDLLNAKVAPKLFISGVNENVDKDDILAQWENTKSSEPCCISLGFKSTDTISNAQEIKEWSAAQNIDSFYLVTSAYHMPRAKLEINHALSGKTILPHPVVSETVKNNHLQFISLTFGEYNKYLLRRVKTFEGHKK